MGEPVERFRKGESQFAEEVFPAELGYLRSRWETVYRRRGKEETLEQRSRLLEEEGAARKLVGLAFSGGGIRSATINLGVAQALHRWGALDHVDYLSTVSGGGYLGSSLSTIMRDGAEFPFEHREGPKESPYLTWLRNHSNYLAERGFLDYARMIAVLLRGILVNFLVLVPLMLLLSVGLALYYGYEGQPPPLGAALLQDVAAESPNVLQPGAEALGESAAKSERWLQEFISLGILREWEKTGPDWRGAYNLTLVAAALAAFYILSFPVAVRVFKVLGHRRSAAAGSDSSVKSRDKFERSFSVVLLVVAGFAVLESLPILIYWFHHFRGDLRGTLAGLAGGSSVVALTLAGKLLSRFKGLTRTLVMWMVGLLGLILPLLVVLYVTESLVWGTPGTGGEEGLERAGGLGVAGVALLAVLIGLMAGGALASLAAAKLLQRVKVVRVAVASLAFLVGFVPFALTSFILGLIVGEAISPVWLVVALAAAIWLFCWLSLDINLTSVHGFYRDRLASAYLVGVDTDTRTGQPLEQVRLEKIDIEEDLNLQDICQGEKGEEANRSIAPYHIVNVAHNLQSSKDPGVRERNSDLFMFSKKFYGGTRTGYCSTDILEAVFPQMDLATAMAISAAAAAPNMGGGTVGTLVAIMTLFNIRLGFWAPNPDRLAKWAAGRESPLASSLWRRFQWRVRPRYFLKEMLSSLDETSRWVNLSDGGHIENLAVYELLRRRCKFIIAGDAEADSAIHFGSLAKLKRFARIDMGIEIDILLDDVRKDEKGVSHQHCAFGRITYPELDDKGRHETGCLLYIKSSVTGDEDEVIREYRAKNADFPHESTADQFFDEGQFEAYRALGFHMVDGLFDEGQSVSEFAAFEKWFEELGSNLAPSLAAEKLFLELQAELSAIQELLQKPEYAHHFYQLYPQLEPEGFEPPAPGTPEAADEMRRNLFLVGKQLRLMENVFVALDLDRPRNRAHAGNRGWMTLFSDWAAAWRKDPSFVEAYRSRARLHSWRFREFCVEVLRLPEASEAEAV